MLRMARKTWMSCLAASPSIWRDSFARYVDAGWIRSPLAFSTVVTGCWVSQSIPRPAPAAGRSPAIATSLSAWPSPWAMTDRARAWAVPGEGPPTSLGPCRSHLVDELLDEQVHLHRVTGVRDVAGALDGDQAATGQLGETFSASGSWHRSRSPLMTRTGSGPSGRGPPPAPCPGGTDRRGRRPPSAVGSRPSLKSPLDAVLDQPGGVGLGQHELRMGPGLDPR